MKFLCSLGVHSYPEVRPTKIIEIIPLIFTSLMDVYGYGKCKRCGKGQRFHKSGEYFSLNKAVWKKINRPDHRTFNQKFKWAIRGFNES